MNSIDEDLGYASHDRRARHRRSEGWAALATGHERGRVKSFVRWGRLLIHGEPRAGELLESGRGHVGVFWVYIEIRLVQFLQLQRE